MNEFFSYVHETLLSLQHLYLSGARLEHTYLIFMLLILLITVSEKLRNPHRKLRNRSDLEAWGRRAEPTKPARHS